MSENELLYIVPAYNEEKTIVDVLDPIKANKSGNSDIIVVDDGSIDDTRKKAEENGVRVISHPINLGGGAAYRTGYKYAVRNGYDYTLTIDADGQHDPAFADDVLEPVMNGDADLCIGSRFRGEAGYDPNIVRYIGNRFFAKTTSLLSHQQITDATSGYRATSRRLFTKYADNYPDSIYAIEATIWAARHGYDVTEVPVTMSRREEGQSYLTPSRLIKYPFQMMYALCRAL